MSEKVARYQIVNAQAIKLTLIHPTQSSDSTWPLKTDHTAMQILCHWNMKAFLIYQKGLLITSSSCKFIFPPPQDGPFQNSSYFAIRKKKILLWLIDICHRAESYCSLEFYTATFITVVVYFISFLRYVT